MHNEIISIGPFTIYGYGLMIAIGIIAAYLLAEYRAKKLNMNSDHIFNMVIWCAVFGFLGAKLLYVITRLPDIIADPSILKDASNGFVVYGGIIAGVAAAWDYSRWKKLSFLAYFDLLIPSVALAQGFGRIGCFLAGCCYGEETTSAFHVIFHDSAYAPNNVALLPTQLMSSALNFAHAAILLWFAKRGKKKDGQVGALYLILYSIGRFCIEFFRGDLIRGAVGPLSTSQFIAIFVCLGGVLLMIWCGKRNVPELSAAGETAKEEVTEKVTEEVTEKVTEAVKKEKTNNG